MEGTGAITGYIDVAQIMIYLFWGFFAALIIYLRREDKREGYPLESERSGHITVQGFPAVPTPKTFHLSNGEKFYAPHSEEDDRPIHANPTAGFLGAPLEPIGDPMLAGVGPGAYAMRSHEPERMVGGEQRVVAMRNLPEFSVEGRDPDPRGMAVMGMDGLRAGAVTDIWVDLSESAARYVEVELDAPGSEGGGGSVLLPLSLSRISRGAQEVRVASILAAQFRGVPTLENADVVTMFEEERIGAYYGSGHLYATPERQESLI